MNFFELFCYDLRHLDLKVRHHDGYSCSGELPVPCKLVLDECQMFVISGDPEQDCVGFRILHIRDHYPQFFGTLTINECLLRVLIHPAS